MMAVPDRETVRAGLGLEALEDVQRRLGLAPEALEQTLHVSTRTLQRRRKHKQPLTAAESDRVWRLIYMLARATVALGDEASARTWLTTPKALLGGETPLQRLDTEPGFREVEDMLTVIDETSAA